MGLSKEATCYFSLPRRAMTRIHDLSNIMHGVRREEKRTQAYSSDTSNKRARLFGLVVWTMLLETLRIANIYPITLACSASIFFSHSGDTNKSAWHYTTHTYAWTPQELAGDSVFELLDFSNFFLDNCI